MTTIILHHTYRDFFSKLDNVDVARDFLEQLILNGYRLEAIPSTKAVHALADEVAIDMAKRTFPTFYLRECPPPNGYIH